MRGHGETALQPAILLGHGPFMPGVHRATVEIIGYNRLNSVKTGSPWPGHFVSPCPAPNTKAPQLPRRHLARH